MRIDTLPSNRTDIFLVLMYELLGLRMILYIHPPIPNIRHSTQFPIRRLITMMSQ